MFHTICLPIQIRIGNIYDFGFGLNWKGVIHDNRTEKYVNAIREPLITIKNNQAVISCPTPGVQIYYTSNDSIPSFTASNRYTKPIPVKTGTALRAIAKKPGFNNSRITEYKVK